MRASTIAHYFSLCLCTVGFALAAAPTKPRETAPGKEYTLNVTAHRLDALYRCGEPVRFAIEVRQGGRLSDGVELQWVLSNDGGAQLQEGRTTTRQGRATVEGSLKEAGFMQCSVTVREGEKTWTALGAAGVDPHQIKPSLPVPADFDAFWGEQKRQLAAVPANPRLTPVESGAKEVEAFDLQADAIGAPVSAYFARPRGARPKSLPIVITLHSASGVQSSFLNYAVDWAREGVLAIDMNPHGLRNGQPREYYSKAGRAELNGFRSRGSDSRETNYFREMFLRTVRAIDFLTSQPEWDGQTVVVSGSSMGGAQSLAAAGLDQRVSFLAVNMPAMCDPTGVLVGRASVWPRYLKPLPPDPPKEKVEAVRYYDTANFAARTRAAAYFNVGFIDTACPPSSVYVAYNQIRAAKEISHDIPFGHVQTPATREALRMAIRRHVSAMRHDSKPVLPPK